MGDAFLTWQEAYAVGHHGLDREHRHLVDLINQIAEVRAESAGVPHLRDHANTFYLASVEHFRHENSVMRDIIDGAYLLGEDRARQLVAISESAINDHCAEHARALIRLESMIHEFLVIEKPQGPMLAGALKAWFLDHAINHDAHLKDMFQATA